MEEFKHVRVKESTHKRLKVLASVVGVSMDALVESMVEAKEAEIKNETKVAV